METEQGLIEQYYARIEGDEELIAAYLLGRIAYHQDRYRKEFIERLHTIEVTLAFSHGLHGEGLSRDADINTVVETVKSYCLDHSELKTGDDSYLSYLSAYLGEEVIRGYRPGEYIPRMLKTRAAVLFGLKDRSVNLPPRKESELQASIRSMMPHSEGG